MAALDFPASPSTNDIHTENGVSWKWNGSAWTRLGDVGAQGAQGAQGAAGTAGAQGSAGAQGAQGVQGAAGSAGAAGAQGHQGVQGAIGYASTNFIHAQTLAVVGVSTFTGNITANGNVNLNGNVDLGNSGTDTITPNGRFDANILPHIDNNQYYKLGNSGYRWHTAHFGTGGIKIDGGGINAVGIVTATSFSGSGADLTGITAGYWGQDSVGLNTNTSVGVNTSTVNDKDLQGIGNTFNGMYISNGMMIYDNALSGNHYIGTAFNGLMAGPVTIHGTLSVDGQYVVV